MKKTNGATPMAKVAGAGPSINDVSELLEKLLLKELPLKKNGIEISFDQPNREWSGRLNGPTLNLFLYDLRKNKYRESQWESVPVSKTQVMIRRPALKVDLHYVITAWVIDGNPDEEHYLLTAALLALARHPRLPSTQNNFLPPEARLGRDFLPSALQHQPGPLPINVAEPEDLVNPADVWSALDNELRPSITCTITLALDPFQPIVLPMPSGSEVRVGPMPDSGSSTKRPYYQAECLIHSDEPLEDMRLVLAGRGIAGQGLSVPFEANESLTEYEFYLPQLKYGDYHVDVLTKNQKPVRFTIALPTTEPEKEEQKGGISFSIKIKERTDM